MDTRARHCPRPRRASSGSRSKRSLRPPWMARRRASTARLRAPSCTATGASWGGRRSPTSSEAHAARIAYGDLFLARGDAQAALDAYDVYLRRGGGLAEEASFGRVRALRALGRGAEERAATDAFLARWPASAAAPAL